MCVISDWELVGGFTGYYCFIYLRELVDQNFAFSTITSI